MNIHTPPSGSTVKILIAEDSPTQAQRLQHILQRRGYHVIVTSNGRQALEAARQSKPTIIISDVVMPEMDGYELCKAIKTDKILKDIPVMLVTTLSDPQDVIRGLECGADNFLRKPYEEGYLLSRVNHLLMNLELRKNQKMQMGIEMGLGGQKYFISSERQQILDLLISTYEQAVQINEDLKQREKELGHSNQVLNGLYRIADGLNHAASEREVAELALERALELPGIQAGWVSLREGESGFRLAAARNLPPALEAAGAMEGDCTCRRRLISGELDHVTNILECERLGKAGGDTRGLRYHASIPLWIGGRTLGVMNLVGPEKGLFNEDELKILYSVGNQVAVAIERARLHQHMEQLIEEKTAKLAAEVEQRKRIQEEQARMYEDLRKSEAASVRSEKQIRVQLEHLRLLDQITRSTGERQDLKSIFQVVVRTLEDSLPVDFGCVCLYDATTNALTVNAVGVKSEALAHQLAITDQSSIDIDQNGLSRCVQGQLVYEPDVSQLQFLFPQRLASGGLRSVVMAPLKSESRVFGVLVVARREANAFDSSECEFLRQLSEHVALAAHQAQLYESLQQAYDELRQTQAAAIQEERLRTMGQMASGVAHDINNALSPVSLYTESLLETEKNLSERGRGYLQTIQRAVEDVAKTVARLRDFYRQREQQIALAPADVNQLAQQVLDLTRARWSDMAQSRGVTIQAHTELATDPPQVMGVESEIRESLTNLVFNAVDAMPEGGTLTVRTRLTGAAPDQSVIVEVADTGVGMDEETRRRCLEPFYTTKGERGTGLGLAMVFGMVQRHSAGIEIDSAPGVGTTMRLVFAVPTAAMAESGQPTEALKMPRHLRLLLVDDDPVLIQSLRDALQTDGHEIVTANGGQAGIDAFCASIERNEPYDAVLTDLGMPYVDGRKVAATVKAASPATPVIMLTGWGQRLVAERDIPAHVDRVLAKPPKLREVREALAQLCCLRPSEESS